jgi:uncharacterized DUF497 family protein
VIEIEFDPAKDAINRKKHGIGLAAAAVILRGRHIRQHSVLPNDSNEERWVAVGRIEGRFLACVYTMRVNVYRVISLRAARTKERRAYEEAFRSE